MKQDIEIKTADGVAKAKIFRADPSTASEEAGKSHPGVLLYMDAMGPREVLDEMAQRLANSGYVVLLPDLFYRFAPYGPFTGRSISEEPSRAQILKMVGGTSQEETKRDTGAFLDALTAAGVSGPVGIVGYCMGGNRAFAAAGSYPDRIAAAASFHGGNLANEAEDSPHRLAGNIKGRIYIGVAGIDRSFPPEQSTRLAEALRSAEVDHVIENYVGMAHGWAVPDHDVYDTTGGERHWKRLLNFFDEVLH